MKNAHIDARIREGLTQAQQGDFVSDKEMEEFFARRIDASVEALWIDECMHRVVEICGDTSQFIDVDDVMLKYRQ